MHLCTLVFLEFYLFFFPPLDSCKIHEREAMQFLTSAFQMENRAEGEGAGRRQVGVGGEERGGKANFLGVRSVLALFSVSLL